MTQRAARLHRLSELMSTQRIGSQAELVGALQQQGISITQATLSRDLEILGALKVHDAQGGMYYSLPLDATGEVYNRGHDRLSRVFAELVLSIEFSGNMVVVHTHAGAASYVASAIDRSGTASIIGTVAGSDTVLAVTRALNGGEAEATELRALMKDHANDLDDMEGMNEDSLISSQDSLSDLSIEERHDVSER